MHACADRALLDSVKSALKYIGSALEFISVLFNQGSAGVQQKLRGIRRFFKTNSCLLKNKVA